MTQRPLWSSRNRSLAAAVISGESPASVAEHHGLSTKHVSRIALQIARRAGEQAGVRVFTIIGARECRDILLPIIRDEQTTFRTDRVLGGTEDQPMEPDDIEMP
ncbi:MAG: hypothetical protein OEU36_21675 [Gammaproteobacteria bacterium]|nr:hypothetical protein [Gammaproteobacteria bacterium]